MKKYLIPAVTFQSLVIAGGYGTITWVIILVFVLPVLFSPFLRRDGGALEPTREG